MNKQEARNYQHLMNALDSLGFAFDEAQALVKIERTLHRWSERECGDDHGCIERDEVTNKPIWRSSHTDRTWSIPDREKGALKRLDAIMARHPKLSYYYQTDPRGCALYILRPGDVPEGSRAECCYSNGIAVCY